MDWGGKVCLCGPSWDREIAALLHWLYPFCFVSCWPRFLPLSVSCIVFSLLLFNPFCSPPQQPLPAFFIVRRFIWIIAFYFCTVFSFFSFLSSSWFQFEHSGEFFLRGAVCVCVCVYELFSVKYSGGAPFVLLNAVQFWRTPWWQTQVPPSVNQWMFVFHRAEAAIISIGCKLSFG